MPTRHPIRKVYAGAVVLIECPRCLTLSLDRGPNDSNRCRNCQVRDEMISIYTGEVV